MNQRIILRNKLAPLSAALCVVMLAFSTNAGALTLFDSHELGFVNFGIPSGDADRTAYVNHLIGMALGSTDTALGQDFTRSNNDFGPLPTATFGLNGSSTSIDLGTSLYSYLFAKYDGPNYGAEVWYVGDLFGLITIPATAGGYGLSGWTLFGPGTECCVQVPEPSTLTLFGVALSALALALRYRRRTFGSSY
jgi:PEP-CTERM motif